MNQRNGFSKKTAMTKCYESWIPQIVNNDIFIIFHLTNMFEKKKLETKCRQEIKMETRPYMDSRT